MNPPFSLHSCSAGDTAFAAVLENVYPQGIPNGVGKGEETDFLQQRYVVYASGKPVARAALFSNPAIRQAGASTLQLGLFECTQEPDAALFLFEKMQEEARRQGAGWLIGPLNGTTWNSYRLITEKGLEALFLSEIVHPDYYPQYWQQAGFRPVSRYFSAIAPIVPTAPSTNAFWMKREWRIEKVVPENLEAQLGAVYALCVDAFAKSPFFTSISQTAFIGKLSAVKPLLSSGLSKVVYDTHGDALAFALCFPDVYQPDRLILKTIARKQDLKMPELIQALYDTIAAEAHNKGMRSIIHAFMHQDNRSIRRSEDFGGKIIREYTLFGLPL